MMRNRKSFFLLFFCLIAVFFSFYAPLWNSAQTNTDISPTREIHLLTVEYQHKLHNREQEVYRFDPGSITVHQGEKIRLHVHGFHGKVHTFSIPGLNVNGSVKKGDVATVNFTATKLGTYEIICHNHATTQKNGPMIAYLTVIK